MPEYRVIARVAKTHGRKGEVVTVPVHGLPSLIQKGMDVCIVPPRLKGPRWREVVDVASDPRGQLVALSGIDSIGEAEALVDRYLLVRAADLPEDIAFKDVERLIGREAEDPAIGPIGRIVEVMQGPANDVWVVRGERGEVLLPIIPDVVSDIPEDGSIEVHVPKGLLPEREA